MKKSFAIAFFSILTLVALSGSIFAQEMRFERVDFNIKSIESTSDGITLNISYKSQESNQNKVIWGDGTISLNKSKCANKNVVFQAILSGDYPTKGNGVARIQVSSNGSNGFDVISNTGISISLLPNGLIWDPCLEAVFRVK